MLGNDSAQPHHHPLCYWDPTDVHSGSLGVNHRAHQLGRWHVSPHQKRVGGKQGTWATLQVAVDLPVLLWCTLNQLLMRLDITVTSLCHGQALVTLNIICLTLTYTDLSKEINCRNYQWSIPCHIFPAETSVAGSHKTGLYSSSFPRRKCPPFHIDLRCWPFCGFILRNQFTLLLWSETWKWFKAPQGRSTGEAKTAKPQRSSAGLGAGNVLHPGDFISTASFPTSSKPCAFQEQEHGLGGFTCTP